MKKFATALYIFFRILRIISRTASYKSGFASFKPTELMASEFFEEMLNAIAGISEDIGTTLLDLPAILQRHDNELSEPWQWSCSYTYSKMKV